MAMPTPKSTPARTRFDPPSPKAKVSPETTIATSESPRAMVLVKASWSTFTAFSQGEFPWAKAGAARTTTKMAAIETQRDARRNRWTYRTNLFIETISWSQQGACEESSRPASRKLNQSVRGRPSVQGMFPSLGETPGAQAPGTTAPRTLLIRLYAGRNKNPPHIYLICVWRGKMCRRESKIFEILKTGAAEHRLALFYEVHGQFGEACPEDVSSADGTHSNTERRARLVFDPGRRPA